MTVSLTIDRRWGGFYFHGYKRGETASGRICFGYVALDYFPTSVEEIFMVCINKIDELTAQISSPAAIDPIQATESDAARNTNENLAREKGLTK